MCKWYKEMNCYVIARPDNKTKKSVSAFDQRAKIEHSFRQYAAVFSKVKLVVEPEQEKDIFLSFPRLIDESQTAKSRLSLKKAFADADSDAVFIGTTDINDFPISLLSNLVKKYNGEKFLGYKIDDDEKSGQHLFGIYKNSDENHAVDALDFDDADVKLLTLPEDIDSSCLSL